MKIEVGKWYVMRNGEVVGPMRKGDDQWDYYDPDDDGWYADGRFRDPGEGDSKFDIVAEAEAPTPSPARDQDDAKQVDCEGAFAVQIGGSHYNKLAIQPAEYILKNRIPWAEGCVIAYVTRWRDKGGIEDIQKAIHTLQLLVESEGQNGDTHNG